MSRAIAVLRPEPGNRVTAAAIEGRGARAIRLPLFAVHAVAWDAPDPTSYDALILTSANAVRHGGAGLARLLPLPVFAVGEATAEVARGAGFTVRAQGSDGAEALVTQAEAMGVRRALHLAGRERTLMPGGIVARIVTVYASEPLPVPDAEQLRGCVALVQSARAGARLRELTDAALRATIAIAAISAKAAAAAGDGWEQVAVAASAAPDALIDTALRLAD